MSACHSCGDKTYRELLDDNVRVRHERDEARKYAEERNDEANKLQRYLNMAAQERDEARAEVERLRGLKPIGTYSLDWNHEQERQNTARAAYQRGAEAMREAAASIFNAPSSAPGREVLLAWADSIRALPVPEDKP